MSNVDSESSAGVQQGKNEPAITGANDSQSSSISEDAALASTARKDGKPTDEDIDNMTTDELLAMSRAAESRMNVFTSLSLQQGDRHSAALEDAKSDFARYADALKDHNMDVTGAVVDPTATVPDKEGTAPTLADATGSFAADAEVANIGGIGINDSNADPDGALEKLNANADRDFDPNSRGTSPNMDRSTTRAARKREGRPERVPLKRKVTA